MTEISQIVQRALSRDEHLLLEAPSYLRRAQTLLDCLEREAIERGEVAILAVGSSEALRRLASVHGRERAGRPDPLMELDSFVCRARQARLEGLAVTPLVRPASPGAVEQMDPQGGTPAADCLGEGCPFASSCSGLQNLMDYRTGVRLTTHRALFQWLRFQARNAPGSTHGVTMLALDDADLAVDAVRCALGDVFQPADMAPLIRSLEMLCHPTEAEQLRRLVRALESMLRQAVDTLPGQPLELDAGELIYALEQAAALYRVASDSSQGRADATWAAWELDARHALRIAQLLHDASTTEDRGQRFRVVAGADGPALVSELLEPGRWLAENLFKAHRSVIVSGPALRFGGHDLWLRDALGVPDQAASKVVRIDPAALRSTRLVVPESDAPPADPMVASATALDRLMLEVRAPVLAAFNSIESRDYALQPTRAGVFDFQVVDEDRSIAVVGPRRRRSAQSSGVIDHPDQTPQCLFLEALVLTAVGHGLALTSDDWANDGFIRHVLPRAVLHFRRRLDGLFDGTVRHRAVVIHDSRILGRGYSGFFLAGLEEMPLFREYDDLGRWIETGQVQKATPCEGSGRARRRRGDSGQVSTRPRALHRARQLNLFPRKRR